MILMAGAKFDEKSFNPQAFGYMVERVPNLKTNEIRKSRALAGNPDIKTLFDSQNGTEYARLAMRGLLTGDAVNYDGQTDITATSTKTFERGVVVTGRAKAWVERDFSHDITGGIDFMQNIADQVGEFKEGLDMDTIYAMLKGIYAMTGVQNLKFVEGHTHDISADTDPLVAPTTLNTAMNKACGANKKAFSLVFIHSDVSTRLENLNLLEFLKYTDSNGITRDLAIGTWNGRIVIVDDDLPTEEIAAAGGDPAYTKYTTYILGNGAIDFEDVGAKVPYEMKRDPKTNGGEDTLYMRQRKVFAPFGISYEKTTQATKSPTDVELARGDNWTLVNTGESVAANRTYINHKAIPIARIISRG